MQPPGKIRRAGGVVCFQYPRSDRRRCNVFMTPSPTRKSLLSVSSVGSEAMQLLSPNGGGLPNTGSFSILGRIGGDATREFRCAYWNVDGLSVSSVGSEAMQHRSFVRPVPSDWNFQYPRSDRRRCNLDGWLGTLTQALFQYPRSDRRRCNFEFVGGLAVDDVRFQYPRSDRRRCNWR